MYENGKLADLNITEILPNRFQPRILFDELKLNELAKSIRKHGVIQPIVVRPINNKYEIIAGERRYKASLIAGRMKIPAIIVPMNDKDAEEIALLENVQRQPLSPIEEAVSFKRILDNGYITGAELSEKIGKSQSYIAKKISLLNLDDIVQEALLNGKISERHARSLLKIQNADDQVAMLNRIINERLTVKMADREIRNYKNKPLTTPKPHVMATIITKDTKVEDNLFEQDNPTIKKESENNMDIDKIMNEAKDINQTPQVNDISDLMRGANNTMQNPSGNIIQPNTASEQNMVNENKFVNFVPNTPNSQQNLQQNNQNTNFNNIFGQTPNIIETTNGNVNTNNIAAANNEAPFNTSQPTNTINQQQINTNTPNTPFEINTSSDISIPEPPTTMPPVEPISPAYHTIGTNDYQNTPNTNIEEPIMPTQTPFPSNTQTEPLTMNQNINTMSPLSINNNNIPSENPVKNFSQVINLIRECSDKIEKLGYIIDIDEMDLGDNYQVTIKINK